ncbi:MAG: cation:proton antiporter [Myxococcota bacterium]|nr:cation:proton antiporter [Myxococcota bacterium]
MGHLPLLDELTVIAGLGVIVTVILARLRLPAVAGLLLAGALLGPHGLGLVRSRDAIETLAELGVVMLLFTIGLEFSLERLKHIFRQVAVGGLLQVGLTIGATALAAVVLGESASRGLFFGFVMALSSTAIVLRALTERRETDAPHGRFIVGTLIFQDLCVVPMVLIVPMLGQSGTSSSGVALAIAVALAKAAAVVALVIIIARLVVPKALGWVDASRSREVFLLAVLALCMGTAWLTSLAGLSLALGAFLGGMVVADTEYGHRAMGEIMPLRDAFVSVFFVSLGMMFDAQIALEQPLTVGLVLTGFVVFKGLFATIAALAMRFPARVAWLAGVGLAQFGEFGFVLVRLGQKSGLVTAASMDPWLTAGVLSMFLTPLLARMAPHFTAGEKLLGPLERLLGARSIDEADTSEEVKSGHVIIVGYGVAGRIVAKSLAATETSYIVLELNADTVRAARERGEPVYYGDATSIEALGHAHLESARALVLLMNDAQAVKRIVDTVRRVASHVPILLRARYLAERAALLDLGARDVVAEEVEGGVEIMARLLRWLEAPRNVIDEQVREVRSTTQRSERTNTLPRRALSDMAGLSELKIESLLIRPGMAAAGQSLISLELRKRTGALIVAVRRGDSLLDDPDPAAPLEPGDVAYLVGRKEAVKAAMILLGAKVGGGSLPSLPPIDDES